MNIGGFSGGSAAASEPADDGKMIDLSSKIDKSEW